jgi:hypothetical protein
LLYNPEQVKSYLRTRLSRKGASIKRSTKKTASGASVTRSLLKSSSYPFAADLSEAIDKLSQGLSVEAVISTNIQGSDLAKVATEAWFTLDLLYYFGLLTRASKSGTLQFANDTARNEVGLYVANSTTDRV